MRIAFCGKAGAGKSTLSEYLVRHFGFVKYSFASQLKDIAKELFKMEDKDRTLLQNLGGKMREIDPHVWVRFTMNQIEDDGFDDVVIDDLRFKNEELFLRACGFVIVKCVGRGWELTKEQLDDVSEQEVDMIIPDFTIHTDQPLEKNFRTLRKFIIKNKLDELRMSKEYYDKAKKKTNKNYQRGRDFEYRVKRTLRKAGWHTMRKFASKDDIWLVNGKQLHVPVDLTAYKDGYYLIVSVKYSINHPTTILDDPKRDNLVAYCELFGDKCIPVFAGVNERRRVYFIDFRDGNPIDINEVTRFQHIDSLRMVSKQIDSKEERTQMEKLMKFSWTLLDLLKEEYDIAEAQGDANLRVKWAAEMVKLVNIINRVLDKAGESATEDDLTTMLADIANKVDDIE